MHCSLCNVYCPSSYQYDEHIQGRKHAERLKGKLPPQKDEVFAFIMSKAPVTREARARFFTRMLVRTGPLLMLLLLLLLLLFRQE